MIDYPSNLDVRPLTEWPGALTPFHQRRRSSFDSTLSQTLSTLNTELHQLGARHPVLEVAIPADQFRIDGRPRANARETHPGVVLSLPSTNVGALRYATDRFDRWQDNLRAIALGLEALRKVDRYGITRRGEQYAGFKALPPGSATAMPAAATMSVDEAARSLVDAAALPYDAAAAARVIGDPDARTTYYRAAARRHHPDTGGVRVVWDMVELAKRTLDEHGGPT